MTPITARELLRRYHEGACTEAERYIFEQWYEDLHRSDRTLLTELDLEKAEQQMLSFLNKKMEDPKSIPLWPRIAAAILIIISVSTYLLLQDRAAVKIAQSELSKKAPSNTNKATLTLSNGKQISLNDAAKGTLTKEDNQLIKKDDTGTVSYEDTKSLSEAGALIYNSVTTPIGGQWSVVLPDGTKVMLDAESSVRYPVKFTGKDRTVFVTGQAYFEVALNAQKPFRVKIQDQVIEVLGTHFNVNAYSNEDLSRITLLEGGIKISKGAATAILSPGQEAETHSQTNGIVVKQVDVENSVAWRKGRFFFNKSDIQSIMRQLSRWYDITATYRGKMPEQQFTGDINRDLQATQIIDILRNYYNIPFQVEGKKVIVGE